MLSFSDCGAVCESMLACVCMHVSVYYIQESLHVGYVCMSRVWGCLPKKGVPSTPQEARGS